MQINPNFTLSSYPDSDTVEWEQEGIVMEFPYFDMASYQEQREKALSMYDALKDKDGRIVTLTRLSFLDLEEGDYSPTLLRKSDDPDYVYDGFAEVWER